ncbi:hypothetical protein EPUS_04234 [Endocarpon pusillum Z07020]|uniref:Tudor domain-containing protein n=1 Tax=Endocarpon pusillum (strain Z07020 / HMAS-L-300199) TaxID=1263415 RepID=U1HU38_ENDPU|nr:uncharacterized protein EPUS_04234 [Endocarpon pusillum Z07020]ERF72799.1 hypothetical protein EPUS_04234 [Endocarpon pusillum Z07020]
MSSEVAALEGEIREYELQLETVVLGLQNDPENEELKALQLELDQVISLTRSAIAELKPATAPVQPKQSSPQPQKWDKSQHPAFQAGYRKIEAEPATEESQTPVAFKVNDTVLARWKTGDGAFYPARITSITGSSSKPVYIVTFKNYSTTETLEGKDLKLIADSKKRKVDVSPPPNPNVISAAANVNPALASQARQEPSKVSDGPPRPAKLPRKVKAGKELEAGKAKWHDFATKGKVGKVAKKESMFRTPEGVNARVGFTGSGQQMRKDPARSRHIYNQSNDEEA